MIGAEAVAWPDHVVEIDPAVAVAGGIDLAPGADRALPPERPSRGQRPGAYGAIAPNIFGVI